MITSTMIFIYKKDSYKVITIEESKKMHDELVKDGWEHLATIDACIYVQHLLNTGKIINL